MRYLIYLLFLSALISCQIEDTDAPSPNDAFVKYYGELTSYTASDIEIIYDNAGVPFQLVVFGTKTTNTNFDDYFVLRTDLDGNLIDSASYGFTNRAGRDLTGDGNPDEFRGNEIGGQIQPLTNGGFVTIGTSSITDNNRGISDFRILTIGFLDNSLELLNDTLYAIVSAPGNPDLDLIGNDVIELSDGSILLVGSKEFDRGGGITDFDNFFLKYDIENREVVFDGVQGVIGDDEDENAVRVFEKSDGNIMIIGDCNKPSDRGENGGINGTNVQLLEIDQNGSFVNAPVYGIHSNNGSVVSNESVSNAILTTSGFSIVGTTLTSENDEFAFVMSTSSSGVFLSGNLHDSSLYEGIETRGLGVTLAANNDVILLGQYPSFNLSGSGTNTSRGGEGMFVRFDQACRPVEGVESFFGLADGNDQIVDAVTLPDGKIIAVANVDFGGGVRLISIMKLNANGSLD